MQPEQSQPINNIVHFRLDHATRDSLKLVAKCQAVTVSDFIRDVLRKAIADKLTIAEAPGRMSSDVAA